MITDSTDDTIIIKKISIPTIIKKYEQNIVRSNCNDMSDYMQHTIIKKYK